MKKIVLSLLVITSCSIYARETRKPLEQLRDNKLQEESMTVKDFIMASVAAGLTIELANVIRKDENYKKVLAFAMDYPGIFVAGMSASAGVAYMYGKGIKNFFARYKLVSKPE